MQVFQMIKVAVAEKNTTIAQVERETGLANNSISKWKTGSPSAESLFKVAKYLGKPMEFFFGENTYTPINNGIIGNQNTNNTITVGGAATRQLSELEQELLNVYSKIDTMKKAELLVAAKKLLGE